MFVNSLKIIPILIFSFGIFNFCFSQEKFEKESRIKAGEVPENAKDWLKGAFDKGRKPKWFLEYSQAGKSYEAKFHYQGHYHSVEFDSLGTIQDVEIEIKESEVAQEVWNEIRNYFESEYRQVKVEKIQRQFTGSKSTLKNFIKEGNSEALVTRYEIVYQGRNELWELWEAVFDNSGKFISKLKVQIRPVDNLIF